MISGFNIGPITITFYSLCILTGIILAYILTVKESKIYNIPANFVTNLVFWCVIFGILGARIYYVLFNLDYYSSAPLEVLKIWNGGLAIHGGIIAGFITLVIYCLKYKVNILKMLDITLPCVLLAQAIGRWGNFFNGEAHGGIVSKAYLQGLHIPEFIINGMHIGRYYYEPTFLYESILCLIGFFVLFSIRNIKNIKLGVVTSGYFIWYGIVRFFIESKRTDSLMLGNIKMAQLVSIFMIIIGVTTLIIFIIKNKNYSDVKVGKDEFKC